MVNKRKKDKETFSYIPDALINTCIAVSFNDEKKYGQKEAKTKAKAKLAKAEMLKLATEVESNLIVL